MTAFLSLLLDLFWGGGLRVNGSVVNVSLVWPDGRWWRSVNHTQAQAGRKLNGSDKWDGWWRSEGVVEEGHAELRVAVGARCTRTHGCHPQQQDTLLTLNSSTSSSCKREAWRLKRDSETVQVLVNQTRPWRSWRHTNGHHATTDRQEVATHVMWCLPTSPLCTIDFATINSWLILLSIRSALHGPYWYSLGVYVIRQKLIKIWWQTHELWSKSGLATAPGVWFKATNWVFFLFKIFVWNNLHLLLSALDVYVTTGPKQLRKGFLNKVPSLLEGIQSVVQRNFLKGAVMHCSSDKLWRHIKKTHWGEHKVRVRTRTRTKTRSRIRPWSEAEPGLRQESGRDSEL